MYLGFPRPLVSSVRNETVVEASNNQTIFYPNGGYYPGYVDVYVDGIKKVESVDYTASDSVSVVFNETIANGATVQLVSLGVVPISSVVSRTGDTMTGNLTVPNLTVTQNTVTNVVTVSTLSIGQNTVVNNNLTVTGNTIQSGDFSITGNINLTGSLIITGEATSVTTESLAVEDTIITLGANNTSGDTLDIGFAGQYNNGSANVWAGIIRNATDKVFYAFKDYDEAPGNDIDLLDPSFTIAEFRANFNGNLVSNSVTASVVNAGNVNLTSSIKLTGDATGYTQLSTSIYGGDASAGEGRFEYHANAWILNAGSDSANIAIFQRGNLVKSNIDNDGAFNIGNTQIGAAQIKVGNSSVNSVVTATSVKVGNSSSNVTINPTSIIINGKKEDFVSYTSSNTNSQTFHSFSASAYRSAKYLINAESSSEYHALEVSLLHNDTDVFLVQYGEILANSNLFTITASIATGNVNVNVVPNNAVTIINAAITLLS